MGTKQSNNSATPMADAVKIANQRALFSLEWENDTVFKKRELNYKTKAAFQKDLEAGKISKYTTVFIKDSKEIYKNGQYYGAGSSSVVDITDIFNRIYAVEDGGTIQQEDYNTLKSYISDNKLLKAEIDGGNIIFDVIYDNEKITLQTYVLYGLMGILVVSFNISKDLKLTKVQLTIPDFSNVCNSSLKEYVKQESYSSITPSDTINKAIGKLEASVSSEDFVLDLSKYKQGYGVKFNLNPEDLEGVKLAISNKRKILIKTDFSGGSGGPLLIPIVSLQNEDGVFCQYKCKIQYGIYEDTITVTILTSTGECTVMYSTNLISPSKNGDISISSALEGAGEDSAQSSILLKKSGNGTKFLSDNGTYKEINNSNNIVNVSDLLNKISGTIDGGKIEQNDYDKLVGYIESGKILISAEANGSMYLSVNYAYAKGQFMNFTRQFQYGEIILIESLFVNSDLTVKAYQQIIPSGNGDGTKFLSDNGTYKEISGGSGSAQDLTDYIKYIGAISFPSESDGSINSELYNKIKGLSDSGIKKFVADVSLGVNSLKSILFDLDYLMGMYEMKSVGLFDLPTEGFHIGEMTITIQSDMSYSVRFYDYIKQ